VEVTGIVDLKRKCNRKAADRPEGGVPGGAAIACFRCGLCCKRYQPPVTVDEAKAIAGELGMTLEDFLDRYIDDRWFEPGIFLLDIDKDGCVFLEPTVDGRPMLCRIHGLRPQVCRDWQPGQDKKECIEALERDWGLSASPSGKLLGPEEDVRRFRIFLQSLDCGD
jgi:Fe-S-cluster containining protein